MVGAGYVKRKITKEDNFKLRDAYLCMHQDKYKIIEPFDKEYKVLGMFKVKYKSYRFIGDSNKYGYFSLYYFDGVPYLGLTGYGESVSGLYELYHDSIDNEVYLSPSYSRTLTEFLRRK